LNLLIGALTLGLILAVLALGVYMSFRILHIPDITAEGSITLGAAVAAALIVQGVHPVLATLIAALAGFVAGTGTGLMTTKCRIQPLLAGILAMTALYSINLRVMGRSNVPLINETTLATYAGTIGDSLAGERSGVDVLGWTVGIRDLSLLLGSFVVVIAIGLVLYWFYRTQLGTAMRAAGDNPQMTCALGVSVDTLTILGLALSNSLIALSGALVAQYQGFADVQMGIGIIVIGLASVIIGEALVGSRSLGLLLIGAIMGSVLFRLLVAIALRWGLNPNDLKLVTAVFVFVALMAPAVLRRFGSSARRRSSAGAA
jgi:putative ABC transport system permease protein